MTGRSAGTGLQDFGVAAALSLAGIVAAAEARSRPGGGRNIWPVGTGTAWTGEPQVLLVLGSAYHHRREWLRVLLPIRPNSTTGWIPRDNVVLLSSLYWVTIDKHARMVKIYREGKLVHSFPGSVAQS
jgi:hypothetical protein